MDTDGSRKEGLIDEHVDLEDDSINFWATLDVSPHVHVGVAEHETHMPTQEHIDHSLELVETKVRRDLFETEGDHRLEPYVGMEFESGEAAKTFYIAYAGRVGFCARIARSRRSKCNETVIMLRFVCSREGWSREKRIIEGKKTRKRAASIREGCKAMLEVIRKGDGRWIVTKLVKEHNHEVGMPSRVHYIATEGEGPMEPYLGMEFDSLEMARTFYYAYASRLGFEARVRQSRRSLHDESLKMLKLVCSKHRYHSGRENHEDGKGGQSQDPSKDGCDALFEIIRKDGDKWVVSKLVIEHSHALTPTPPSKVRCVRSQGEILVIAKNFTDTRNLLLNRQESQFPREVRYNDLGPEDAQSLLEYFKKTQAENPAFYFSLQIEHNYMINILWADAKARMAYHYFGDAVTFDTSFVNDKNMIPLVTFTGVNHHLQLVIFGCALLVDDSEASFVWLFENWLAAMSGRHPVSLTTVLDSRMAAAVAKVFPNTRHRFCKRHILTKIQEELSDVYKTQNTFETDLKICIDETETSEAFESCWESLLDKYDLRDSTYLQSLYNIRHHWVPVYVKDTFFAEVMGTHCQDNMTKVVDKHFTTKTQLRVAVRQLGQALACKYEKEAQADYDTLFNKPFLKTASPMEKQAADIYTRTVFDKFQEEFVESLGYHVDKIEDGTSSKYRVTKNEDAHGAYMVIYNASDNKATCSCCMFEFSGILCRHALRVFIIVGIRTLPKDYVLKRWTRNAKTNVVSDECGVGLRGNSDEPSAARYTDLCRDAMRCAREGATSAEFYNVAKEALQKAVAEIVCAKQKKDQQMLQNFIKSQKNRRQSKMSQKKVFGIKTVKKRTSKRGITEEDQDTEVQDAEAEGDT
uniref:Protein FAR1-RELATED SEQUENCE n=1 Tax=Anthurium amnicola TaxID=1678845 RepID=A0A1D1ZGT2_9ARAE